MSSLCSARGAIVTGAGRGIGREHALLLAAHGARVVVNDLGGAADGTGSDETPAQEVVRTIKEAGGGLLSVAEGWHRGPTAEPLEDPTKLGPVMMELQARARKNAAMDNTDLD